jgi:hypothetical protein
MEEVPVPVPTPTTTPVTTTPVTTTPSTTPETVARVAGATDPYPNIPTGGEVPGTRTWSTSENSWAEFATNSMASGWRCPSIYGPNGDPYAGESNGYDSGTGKWFRVCVKNPWREPIPRSVTSNYEAQKSSAIAEALAKSESWNAENPGMQKCFEWGPLTNPNGGTESGGVCANPIGVLLGNGGSDTKTITSQTDTKTITSQTDTKTVTSQTDTKTVTSQTDTKTVTSQSTIQTVAITATSETVRRTVLIAEVRSLSNVESRTASASTFLKSYNAVEKEGFLSVTVNSVKSAVFSVSTDISNIKIVLTATKPGSKPIIFTAKTNGDGDSVIKTNKNLSGYTVTLSVNGVKLDSDKAIKK